jgi:hypothetical protein
MADEEDQSLLKKDAPPNFIEKRREQRYSVPEQYQQYMTLQVKSGNQLVPAVIANFSRSGILFETSVPFNAGAQIECRLSLSLLLTRDISFKIQVKYCFKNDNSYIIGAAIDTVADEAWFKLFEEIYDFILLRKYSLK